jgi:protein-arginine kinase activator protein McsA
VGRSADLHLGRFEYAAKLRDEIKELRRELNALAEVR